MSGERVHSLVCSERKFYSCHCHTYHWTIFSELKRPSSWRSSNNSETCSTSFKLHITCVLSCFGWSQYVWACCLQTGENFCRRYVFEDMFNSFVRFGGSDEPFSWCLAGHKTCFLWIQACIGIHLCCGTSGNSQLGRRASFRRHLPWIFKTLLIAN